MRAVVRVKRGASIVPVGRPDVLVNASLARRRSVDSLPRAPKLACRAESALLGYALHVEPSLAQQLAGKCDAQSVPVFRNAHAHMFVEQSRQMAATGARQASQCPQLPRLRKVRGNSILH